MSLCYDFQKWTMITLASIALTLTIGLISLAYGQMPTIEEQQKARLNEMNKMSLCYDGEKDFEISAHIVRDD